MRKHNHTSCILPKNGADKKVFLSAMIKSFLRRMAKMRRYKHESGRSMVEMLGVLAIIGVLSVGCIAGYSKAMQKHKINNTLDELSHNVAVIVEIGVSNRSITSQELNIYGGQCNLTGNRC